MKWEWHYEPFDLNGWIPDFILHGRDRVLVEVKPVTGMKDPLFKDATGKIEQSGWLGETLIASYFLPKEGEILGVGWLNQVNWDTVEQTEEGATGKPSTWWDHAPF